MGVYSVNRAEHVQSVRKTQNFWKVTLSGACSSAWTWKGLNWLIKFRPSPFGVPVAAGGGLFVSYWGSVPGFHKYLERSSDSLCYCALFLFPFSRMKFDLQSEILALLELAVSRLSCVGVRALERLRQRTGSWGGGGVKSRILSELTVLRQDMLNLQHILLTRMCAAGITAKQVWAFLSLCYWCTGVSDRAQWSLYVPHSGHYMYHQV